MNMSLDYMILSLIYGNYYLINSCRFFYSSEYLSIFYLLSFNKNFCLKDLC